MFFSLYVDEILVIIVTKKGILPIHVPELADLEYVPRCFLPWWLLSFVLRPAGIIIYLSSI